MKGKGCLLSWVILILFVSGVYAFNGLFDEDIKSPDFYASNVRMMFKNGQWEEGKRLLDEGLRYYTETNDLNELNGQYYYHHKDYDNARYYLIVAVRDNPENVTAKQLLVKVEEETENYSSAICYVNELLEINPYWQGMWRKKIGLFRLQGNHVEADRLLKRLHQIYPNDSLVQRDYRGSLEERFLREREAGNRAAAISSLYELTEAVPDNAEYYLVLSNLLQQEGNTEEALAVAGRGVSNLPRNSLLVIKKASILAGEGRYQEAMAFVKARMRYNSSASLSRFYTSLLAEAANAARMNDPYVLHGQLYATTGNSEALDYMINTAVSRGYDEDALYYLAEAKRRRGDLPSLLYKEYLVYKRMGNTNKAYSLLTTLAAIDSTDTDIADELALNRLQQAGNLISDGLYSEALPYLKAASRHSYDPDITAAALNREYACYYEMRRYDEALAALDSMYAIDPDEMGYFVRKADILNRQGHAPEALDLLDSAMVDSAVEQEMRAAYVSAYEEIAVPYIKSLIEDGASSLAFSRSARLLAYNPSCVEGLQYAIGMSDLLGRTDAYDYYVDLARSVYPERTDFIVKKAVSYSRGGDYARAMEMLHPWLERYPHNEGIVGAYSENSELRAYELIKAHQPDSAIAVVDSALLFDADNEALYMAKGVAYESMHEYDSAYHYQFKYTPGSAEAAAFKRHLDGLESRSYKNEVGVEYLQGRYGEDDVITSVATASYTRTGKNDIVTGRLNYAGRDGSAAGDDPEDQVPGGVGVQLQASWTHSFSPKWSFSITGGVASKYFPKIMAEAKVEHYFDRDVSLDVHAGYRRISTYSKGYRWEVTDPETGDGGWVFDGWDEYKSNIFSLGVGSTKYWERIALGGKVDGYLNSSNLYVNAAAQFKYYPLDDGRTSIIVTGSAGTAPEANMIDNAMPGSFDKLNTSVGLGGIYMINKHLSAGLMGEWHTFYSQTNNRSGGAWDYTETITTRYRNLYNIHLQLYVHF